MCPKQLSIGPCSHAGTPAAPRSSPTRRSSDLEDALPVLDPPHHDERRVDDRDGEDEQREEQGDGRHDRSEEHTSELQSHVNLVCRLLLEKKKGDSELTDSPQIAVVLYRALSIL